MTLIRGALLVSVAAWGWACSPMAATCVSRQKTGQVASFNGTVEAGQTAVHRVAYGTDGSQNNVNVTWSNQAAADGPQLQFFVTRVTCENFSPADATAACAILARGGWYDGRVATSLIITNGRGNPDVLGVPAEYKLWIVGDPAKPATYSVTTTFFYGPDC